MLMLSHIHALLLCPLCNNSLSNPTTLHCGHSLCSHHLDAPSSSCPLPACDIHQPRPTRPRIPPSSHVRYQPAPHVAPLPIPLTTHRSDVVLNSVIALLDRTEPILRDSDDDYDHDHDHDHDHNDHSRPRKRHKYRHDDDDQHGDDDLLSHLRASATSHRLVPPHLPLPQNPRDSALADFDKKLQEELTCHICYVLFYQPVTTPCQHTFCAKCLQRSLDHSTCCPICRHELPSSYFQDQPFNNTLLSIILKAYPILYKERGDAIEQEERHARLNTPIFVCTLAFPGVPTLIHFFEPRYRLMLRRCLESPHPRFGMIMSPKPGLPQTNYGTMLEIRSVQMLPDGRSMVETMGSTRFRILERGTLDGYMVGRIERIDDILDDITLPPADNPPAPSPPVEEDAPLSASAENVPEELSTSTPPPSASTESAPEDVSTSTPPLSASTESPPEDVSTSTPTLSASSESTPEDLPTSTGPTSEPPAEDPSTSTPPRLHQPTNDELITTCKSFLDRLQRGAAPWVVQRLSSTYGAMPSDPALFSFWVALVLPIEEDEKSKLLPIRSARLRLKLVVYWIEQLNNNWYARVCSFVVGRLVRSVGAVWWDGEWDGDWLGVRDGAANRPTSELRRGGRRGPRPWVFPLLLFFIWCCWSF